MNELLDKYIHEMDAKINRTMKQYNLTEADVSMGNAAQIKGYVMGLREALKLAEWLVNPKNDLTQVMNTQAAIEQKANERRNRTRRSRGE